MDAARTDVGFRKGDPVIYRMTKQSAHPGPRATQIWPNPRGETYSYAVDKLWVVEEVRPDGELVLRTRRGKRHVLRPDAPGLRSPSPWEQWVFRGRFPAGAARSFWRSLAEWLLPMRPSH